jgi:Cof subfamily protein (haloacid dehalogenase superfamily)
MKVQLIAVDMDGTLLRRDGSISAADRDALRHAASLGITVAICSGRVLSSAETFSRPLGLDHPVIACNGGIAVRHPGGEPLWRLPMAPADIRATLEVLTREQPSWFLIFDDAGRVLLPPEEDSPQTRRQLVEDARRDGEQIRFLEDWRHASDEELCRIQKFLVVDNNPERLRQLSRLVEERVQVAILSSGSSNFEVMPCGVNKGTGLRRMCDLLGIPLTAVAAIGDNQNDLDMLALAAWPVAMGNALEQTKACARYVTADHNHDGVAQAVEWLLKQ